MRAEINAAELCIGTFGDPAQPAVLLIMGLGGSMDRWEPQFCERLAAAGRFVIRYDHRDTGGSTTYPPDAPQYTGDDLVADAVGVLDHLGVSRAHVAGLSAGGGIAQTVAVDHPERLLSLTLISTTSAGTGGPQLPPPSDELRAVFSGADQRPEPDWSDREATIAYLLEEERAYAGARGIEEDGLRELLGRVYDRSPSPASAGNHWVVDSTSWPHSRLAGITVPTLVIHGTHDPLFPLPHGESLAREIPNARLVVVDGLGHELPRWAWDEILPALIAHTGSAAGAGGFNRPGSASGRARRHRAAGGRA